MGTKTIGIRDDVYKRLRAQKREDESFTDLIDRLIDESSSEWRDTFGTLSDEEQGELAALVQQSRTRSSRGAADRQREALEAFAGERESDGN